MSILFIILGAILILLGILSITKKWLWIQQGFAKRPVDIEKYMRYMGSVDVIFGLFGIVIGALTYGSHLKDSISLIFILGYLVLKIWGEIKYHKRQ